MVDIILGILFLYLVLVGAYRGFIELFLKSAGIGLGVFAAFKFTPDVSKFLSHYFNGAPFIMDFFSFSLILVAALGISYLIYRLIKNSLLKKKKFSFWDKVVGASGGVLIFVIIVTLIAHYSIHNRLIYDLTASSKIVSFFRR
ncbi:CvpA family protein [Persephonella sp.]